MPTNNNRDATACDRGERSRMQARDAEVRIQIEYVEMPRLKLTGRQVQRLWSLSTEVCEAALAALLRKGFLIQVPDGTYVRCGERTAETEPLAALTRAS